MKSIFRNRDAILNLPATRDPRHSPIRLSRQNSRPAKTFSTHQSKSRKININFCISLDGMTSGPVILRILLELNLEHFWPLRLFARLHIFRNRFQPTLMSTASHGAFLSEKIGFLNPRESENGFCFSFLGASKRNRKKIHFQSGFFGSFDAK